MSNEPRCEASYKPNDQPSRQTSNRPTRPSCWLLTTCTPAFHSGVLHCNAATASPASPAQADFLFFLSSSTSVNSASTTCSFCPSPPEPAPPPPSSGPPPSSY